MHANSNQTYYLGLEVTDLYVVKTSQYSLQDLTEANATLLVQYKDV
jgi:hypothetical protein